MNIKGCVAFFVIVLAAGTAVYAGEVTLVNPGFETGGGSGYNPTTSFSVVTIAPHSGIYHAGLTNETGLASPRAWLDQSPVGGLATPTTVKVGDIIELRYWLYNPSSDPMQPGQHVISNLILFDSILGQQPAAWGPTVLSGMVQDTWVQMTQAYTVSAGLTDSTVKFQILYNDPAPATAAGTQYVDDIQFFTHNSNDRKLSIQSIDVDSVTGAVKSVMVDGIFWQDTSLNDGGQYDFNGTDVSVLVNAGDSTPADAVGMGVLTADLQLGTGVICTNTVDPNAFGLFMFDSVAPVDSGVVVVVEAKDANGLVISAVDSGGVAIDVSPLVFPFGDAAWYNGVWPNASRDRYDVDQVSPLTFFGPTADSTQGFYAVALSFPVYLGDVYGVKITGALGTAIYDVILIPPVLPGSCQAGDYLDGDVNKDCVVDMVDFSLLGQDWMSDNNILPTLVFLYEIPIVQGRGEAQTAILNWYEPQGVPVLGYNCFRSLSPAGPFLQINGSLITTASYTDTGLTDYQRYYYAVSAIFDDGTGFETGRSSAVEVIPAPLYDATAFNTNTGNPVQVSDYMQFASNGTSGSLFYSISVPAAGDYDVVTKLSSVFDERDTSYLGGRSPDRIALYVDGQLWGKYDPLGTTGRIDRRLHVKLTSGNHTLEFRDVDGDATATTKTNLYSFQVLPEEIRDIKLGVADNFSAHNFQQWEDLGAPLVRRSEPWSSLEPGKSSFSWTFSDSQYEGLGTTFPNVEQLPFIYWTPDWANGTGTDPAGVPNNWNDYEEFIRAYTLRYGGRFKTLAPYSEIGWNWTNRGDVTGDWAIDRPLAESLGTSLQTPSNYAQLLKHTYMAMKKVDPDLKIATAAVNQDDQFVVHTRFHREALAELQRLGGDFFDTFALNGYLFPRGFFPNANCENWEAMLAHVTADMADYGFQHRISIPETSYPSGPSTGVNGVVDFNETNQAYNVTYATVVTVAFGVDELSHFAMNTLNPAPDPDDYEYFLSLQAHVPLLFLPKPAYFTQKMLGSLLRGNAHLRYAPAYSPVTGADLSDRIYVFENDQNETIAFFWSDPSTAPTRTGVSIDIPVADLTFPFAVELWNYKGDAVATPATSLSGDTLTVSGLSYNNGPIVLKVQ